VGVGNFVGAWAEYTEKGGFWNGVSKTVGILLANCPERPERRVYWGCFHRENMGSLNSPTVSVGFLRRLARAFVQTRHSESIDEAIMLRRSVLTEIPHIEGKDFYPELVEIGNI
jgi:hypothetical protein